MDTSPGDPFAGSMNVLRLSPETGSISRARTFVHDVVAASGGAADDDLALATSEVVTNAVRHGDGEIAVRVRRDGELARVEVHDGGQRFPVRRASDPQQLGGRGLALVDAVAARWGIDAIADDGKVVWFELVV